MGLNPNKSTRKRRLTSIGGLFRYLIKEEKLLNEDPSEEEIREALCAELAKAFDLTDDFYQPKIKTVFKDLTYETIKDTKFRDLLRKSFPGLGDQGVEDLFDEHDAAPELPLPGGKAGS